MIAVPEASLFQELDPIRYGSIRRRTRLIIARNLRHAALQHPDLQGDLWKPSHGIILRWADLESSGQLERIKETTLRPHFLQEIFADALHYVPMSANQAKWHIQHEFAVNSGSADAAVGMFSPENGKARALIEVKGPTVNLDRDRSQGRTPVEQLWDYLYDMPDCPWGILTNCVSFRLYHREKTRRSFELFVLQEMRKPDVFREFYALFERGGLLPVTMAQSPRADKLLAESQARQKEVGDELYEKYSCQRLGLVRHLHKEYGKSVDTAIHIAQRLIDRIIFIAFCEDRELLNENTLEKAWRDIPPFARATNPRWRNFVELFRSIDRGNERQGVPPYNGGLFREDPEVDELQLDDDWTDFFKEVGKYDFRDEVNVDVLGHLFERSVTELERYRAGGLFGVVSADGKKAAMPKSAQRKRFGIYYTPPEFTGLIVETVVGAVIADRFDGVARSHGVEPGDADARKRLEQESPTYWRECLGVLREVKVCDPACGSGAFLIRAYELLEDRYGEVVERLTALKASEARDIAEAVPHMILKDNLFGVDLSEEAVEITQLALWIRSARWHRSLADLSHNVLCGNSLVDDLTVDPKAMKWVERFPDVFNRRESGFDCVIGNPPWERIKLQEREFFSLSAPEIASAVSAAKRRQLVEKLAKKNPELRARYEAAQQRAERILDYARTSGRYALTANGDLNTYMLFAELARSIVAPSGRVGLLVPSGIATDDTTKRFFNELIQSQSLSRLYDFENKKPYFPDVHRSFKFSAIVFGGAQVHSQEVDFVFFARDMEEIADSKRHIPLSTTDLALMNPNTKTCPIFRSRRDAQLARKVYRRVPILIDRTRKKGGNPWGIRFKRMFDQTNDAELFHSAQQIKEMGFKLDGNLWKKGKRLFLPLYEAKMVQAYDHRAASVVIDEDNWFRQGQKTETSLVSHQNPEFLALPRWWVAEADVASALGERHAPALLAFKNVTSPTNTRTMIAAFIPFAAVGNSAPLILPDAECTARLQCCLLGNLNAFALDYIARQKIGNVNLNFFLIEQFPMLPPDTYAERCPWDKRTTLETWISDRVLKLTCTADDMRPLAEAAGFKMGVHKWKDAERAQLRAELDAAFFHLYGLLRDEVEYVLSTFSGADRPEPTVLGARSIADLILEHYDLFRDQS